MKYLNGEATIKQGNLLFLLLIIGNKVFNQVYYNIRVSVNYHGF